MIKTVQMMAISMLVLVMFACGPIGNPVIVDNTDNGNTGDVDTSEEDTTTLNTCQERNAYASDTIVGFVDISDECQRNSDCVTVFRSNDCFGGCKVAIADNQQEAFRTMIEDLNEEICSSDIEYEDAPCGYMTPRCAYQEAVCINGQCELN